MRGLRVFCLAAVLGAGCEQPSPAPSPGGQSGWTSLERHGITVQAQGPDSNRLNEWLTMAEERRAAVQAFFGRALEGGFTVTVFPTREAINAHWRTSFGSPNAQFSCWMIASANRSGVDMLSPRVWLGEQCGHDGGNPTQVAEVVAHEITHVLHARVSTHPEINGLMSIKWYNEGVASFAAGQQYGSQANLIAAAASVSSLAAVMNLSNSYQVATSMAAFIDSRYGRERNASLMRHASTAEILGDLGLSESEFIAQWRAWCCSG